MPQHPIRTFSTTHREIGYIEFSVPVLNPQDIEAYLQRKTQQMSAGEAYLLIQELMKQATFMWDAFALFVGDPEQARLELRQDDEVQEWLVN